MRPRVRLASPLNVCKKQARLRPQCRYAATAVAVTPAASIEQMATSVPPIARYPSTQPPSYKRPELRKSQLLRQYSSLLQDTPLLLLFQHNNLTSFEWLSIRRELAAALQKVDGKLNTEQSSNLNLSDSIKLTTIQTGIFEAALKIIENFHPGLQPAPAAPHASDPSTASSAEIRNTRPDSADPKYTHILSQKAHEAMAYKKLKNGLAPLLSGPLAVMAFPAVSPAHLAAAISILSPSPPKFPAPTRKANPSYHELPVQNGLQKLLLLGARVEGRVFDQAGTKWVGGIEGGIDGLRGQLVAMLQGFGAGLTNTLEGAGRSLYFTVEGRKGMLEDEGKESKQE